MRLNYPTQPYIFNCQSTKSIEAIILLVDIGSIYYLQPLIYKACLNINLTVYNKIPAYYSSAQEMLRIRMRGFS